VVDCSAPGAVDRFAGRILRPLRTNGQPLNYAKQKFPAAIFYPLGRGNRGRWWSLTHADLEHLIEEQKSGAPESPHAVKPASNGSDGKANQTAA
jgi:hypothetical protein